MKQEPLQNRVNPKGKIYSTSHRGTFMGNRGILHNKNQEIFRDFRLKNWIICKLEFKNRQRTVMEENRYTELFFLDEVTALSAGHRPCAECRRERFNYFKQMWKTSNKHLYTIKTRSIKEIDELVHEERIDKKRKKVTYQAKFQDLPSGTFIQINLLPYIIWNNKIYKWSFAGYEKTDIDSNQFQKVEVLTPISFVNMFKNGFIPNVHTSLLELLK